MAAPLPQGLTLEEFLRLPEEEPALEYEDGMVTQKVSPKRRHGRLQGMLCELVNVFAQPRKLALAFTEARTVFRGRSYVPDVVVYRWDRIPVGADGLIEDGNFESAPDVAIEILSPGQSMPAAIRRCTWYVAHDVPIALLIVPDDEAVLVFRPGKLVEVVQGDEPVDLAEVLPGFELTAQRLFEGLRLA
ncbi:MAG TPA: Uma2 family endonuclease [Chloroflexota bacterium]|jgi:Uma2 family endonuclease